MIGSLLICFPTVAATLFYRFTVTYYSLAMLLAVVSVWVLRKYRMGLILSALALCCSMGIYQAYAPVAIGLFVLTLIRKAFQDGADVKELVMDGLYDCLALILGVGMYMIALKLSLRVANIQLIAYQGADTIGKLVLLDVPKLIGEAYRSFFTIAFQDYCGISGRKLIQMQYLVLGVLSVSTMIYLWAVKVKKRINILASMVLCVLFPLAVNFIVLMCPDGWIYTMMVYSFALVGCLPIVLVDCMPSDRKRSNRVKKIAEKLVGIVVAFLVFCYGYSDNVNYSALYYANRQVENYVASIITQTRMAEGFTPEKKWAFLGEIEDPLLKSQWDEEGYYGGNSYAHHLLINYSRNDWFENYIGYTLPLASDQTIADLSQMDEVKSMPCWPSQGAIKVVGDTVVIKFQNIP